MERSPIEMTGRPAPSDAQEPWTTRRLLAWITRHLQGRGVAEPRVVAEMLLAHVLCCPRIRLYTDVERPAAPPELDRLRALVARAASHEPVHYLVGEAQFHLRAFHVGPSTLIPQPSTEVLVETALRWLADPAELASSAAPRVADIGTGTGCIAITLAAAVPAARVLATDIVGAALVLARRNAERHGVSDRIELRQGPGLEPLRQAAAGGAVFDLVCSNPPYVGDQELGAMDRCVREHVPRSAWYGGAAGLDVIEPLVAGAGPLLRPGGRLAVEIGYRQGGRTAALAAAAGFQDVRILKDHEGLDRLLAARRPA
jgi:release factor glutamine methyltransferase